MHVAFFTDKATEISSDSDAHPNGSRIQDFAIITGGRNSFFLKSAYSQLNISVISALQRLRQEDHEYEASLNHIVTPCLKKNLKCLQIQCPARLARGLRG